MMSVLSLVGCLTKRVLKLFLLFGFLTIPVSLAGLRVAERAAAAKAGIVSRKSPDAACVLAQ